MRSATSAYLLLLSALFPTLPTSAHSLELLPRQSAPTKSTYKYLGEHGPIGWGHLNETFSACSKDTHQSPINLDIGIERLISSSSKPIISISTVKAAALVNLGIGLQANLPNNTGTTFFNGVAYNLLQFHFHTPSEHFIDGEFFNLELHLVHSSEEGNLLVLGVLFDITVDETTTPFVSSVIKNIRRLESGTETVTGALDFGRIIRHFKRSDIYTYRGSLTTPPCSAGVRWLVAEQTLPIKVSSWQAIKKLIKFNARIAQSAPGQTNIVMAAAEAMMRTNA